MPTQQSKYIVLNVLLPLEFDLEKTRKGVYEADGCNKTYFLLQKRSF